MGRNEADEVEVVVVTATMPGWQNRPQGGPVTGFLGKVWAHGLNIVRRM